MKLIYYLLLFTCCIFDFARCDISNEGEKERVNLGAASSKFDEPHTEELDHQAILGKTRLFMFHDIVNVFRIPEISE